MRGQIESLSKRLREADSEKYQNLLDDAKRLAASLTEIEETLYQTQNESPQDPLNYPIRLNNKLSALGSVVAMGDYRPTAQAYAVRQELTQAIDEQLGALRKLLQEEITQFNEQVAKAKAPAVFVK